MKTDQGKTKSQLISELAALRRRVADLEMSESERKQAEEALKERVKELTCLYAIASITERPGITLAEIFEEVVNILPEGWQYPAVTCARVTLNGKQFETENYSDTEWKQSSDIKVYGGKAGQVEVSYLEERPELDEGPFLKEERLLIDGVAERLGGITERKQAEEELRKHREHLEELVEERTKELRESQEKLLTSERLATLGQFSGSISHELRNPLAVIDSSAYYLKRTWKDADETLHEHLDLIRSSVGSAIAIIDSLLNLTRMKEPRLEGLDLIAIADDAIAASNVPTEIEVARDFPEQEVMANGDREQLGMAFQNIIKNADEAMDGKGTLTVTVQTTADGHTEVSFADTGPGIDPENRDRVFQPLFSTKAKGIGFGLSIAKMIIEKHGGTIQAESEPGKGAIIIIRLPQHTGKSKEV